MIFAYTIDHVNMLKYIHIYKIDVTINRLKIALKLRISN